MRLQIDTVAKTITLEQSAKITEILSVVKKMFPNDEWKEYTLQAVQTIYNWWNPISIPVTYTAPTLPWITVDSPNPLVTTSVLNIETN